MTQQMRVSGHPDDGVTVCPDGVPCRVLQVTEAAGGGVRRHLQRIIPALRGLGHDVDVLVGTRRAEAALAADLAVFRHLGCRTAPFGGRSLVGCLLRGGFALRRACRAWSPDVIHLHAGVAGLVGRLGQTGTVRPPLVYSPHAFSFAAAAPGIRGCAARLVERSLLGRTAAMVCVSGAEAQTARDALGCPAGLLSVVENGLEEDFVKCLIPRVEVRAAWGVDSDDILIGCPARLVQQKAPELTLRALAVAGLPPTVRVAFCGSGPREGALRREAARLGLDSRVMWLGHVEDLPRRMAAFDLCLLPSRYEGLSYALLESLAAGVPVVAARIPANVPRPWLQGAVLQFTSGDPFAFRQSLDRMLADLAGWRSRSRELAPRVLAEFSATHQAARLSAIYEGLARRRPV